MQLGICTQPNCRPQCFRHHIQRQLDRRHTCSASIVMKLCTAGWCLCRAASCSSAISTALLCFVMICSRSWRICGTGGARAAWQRALCLVACIKRVTSRRGLSAHTFNLKTIKVGRRAGLAGKQRPSQLRQQRNFGTVIERATLRGAERRGEGEGGGNSSQVGELMHHAEEGSQHVYGRTASAKSSRRYRKDVRTHLLANMVGAPLSPHSGQTMDKHDLTGTVASSLQKARI